MVASKLSVLLLTEDTGDDAHAVMVALVKKILWLIEPGLDEQRVAFNRVDARARAAMNFTCYKSSKPRDYEKKLLLAQAIANHLLGAPGPAAVFVHVDADRRWSERDPEQLCDNHLRFNQEIRQRVSALLERAGHAEMLGQIVALVPFWCIESWLFQNVREALAICAKHRHVDASQHFERWQGEPHLLDEEERPEELISFGAKYNRRLAEENFPGRRVWELRLSFAAAVEEVRRSACAWCWPTSAVAPRREGAG